MSSNQELTKESALAFLRAHQPMPNLDELSEDEFQSVMKEWAQASEYFTKHPSLDAIPLFLGSFSEGDDAEVYQLFQDVVQATVGLDVDAVARRMIKALSPSSPLPTRVHAAEVCGYVLSKDRAFHETLLSIIENDDEDEDVHMFCASAFSVIGQEGCFDVEVYKKRVKSILEKEEDEDVVMMLSDLLGDDIDDNERELKGNVVSEKNAKQSKKKEKGVNKESAFEFLRLHQPMPDTTGTRKNKRKELIRQWNRVCDYFIKHPNIESIPLFFGSFGDFDDFEIYQKFEEVVASYEPDEIAPYFIGAFSSASLPARMMAAITCQYSRSKKLNFIETLMARIEDVNEDVDVRGFCALALSRYDSNDIAAYKKRIQSVLEKEVDDDIVEYLKSIRWKK